MKVAVIDVFRVEAIEPPRILRLRAEMKVPGAAWLAWCADERADDTSTLRRTATFRPRWVVGRAYGWLLLPVHMIIWKRLAERRVALTEHEEHHELRGTP